MKQFIQGFKLLFLMAILISGVAAIADESQPNASETAISDSAITEAIQAKFAGDSVLTDATISVDTDGGFVTLNGIVKSEEQIGRAEELANTVEGVRQVSSNLKVDSASQANSVNAEIQEDRQDVPVQVSENQPSENPQLDPAIATEDTAITEKVKQKMSDDAELSGDQIEVDTQDGVVELSGTVQSEKEVDRAIQLAKTVDGVKKVKSNIVVKTS